MKALATALILCAGSVLCWIGFKAPARDYVAPTEEQVAVQALVPQVLVGEVPAGCIVTSFQVDGMCCRGCTGKIYERLKSSPGVIQAAVDFERQRADVVVSQDADLAQLESTLCFDKYSAKLSH